MGKKGTVGFGHIVGLSEGLYAQIRATGCKFDEAEQSLLGWALDPRRAPEPNPNAGLPKDSR